jgi:hypothetical protein
MSVTTTTIWVCSKCGAVSHIDGGSQPSWVTMGICGIASPNGNDSHTLKPVLVVVPYA